MLVRSRLPDGSQGKPKSEVILWTVSRELPASDFKPFVWKFIETKVAAMELQGFNL